MKTVGELLNEERERGQAFWNQMRKPASDQWYNWRWLPPVLPPREPSGEEGLPRILASMSEYRTYERNAIPCRRCERRHNWICHKPGCLYVWCQFCWSPGLAVAAGFVDPLSMR